MGKVRGSRGPRSLRNAEDSGSGAAWGAGSGTRILHPGRNTGPGRADHPHRTPLPPHRAGQRAPTHRSPTGLRCQPRARGGSLQRAERAPPDPGRRHSPQRWLSGRRARWREAGQTCYCRTYTSSTDCARRKQSGQRAPGRCPRACERQVPARPSGRALRRVRAKEAPRRPAPAPRPGAQRVLSACPSPAALSLGVSQCPATPNWLRPRSERS